MIANRSLAGLGAGADCPGRIPARGLAAGEGQRVGEHKGIEGYLVGGFGLGGGGRTWVAHGSSSSPAMAAALRRAPVRDGNGGRVREYQWEVGNAIWWSVGVEKARRG